MKNKYIRLLVILGSFAIAGIVVVQVFWLRKAFDLREKQFNYNVTLALDNIVSALCEYNQTDVPNENPIEQVAGNYFVVRINNVIPPAILQSLLTSEFQKRVIDTDFEFTIYDCGNQQVIYKDYVNLGSDQLNNQVKKHPDFEENEYYFDVFFPQKTVSLVNQMGIWVFSSSVLLIVVAVFALALVVIFRQKRISEVQRDFVNNMAHEFNTPISSIGLATDYFRGQKNIDEIKKSGVYLSIIEKENMKLKKHVEGILQIGKYEQEGYRLEMVAADLVPLIAASQQELLLNYHDKELTYEITGNTSAVVFVDVFHLKSIFYNLFENVIKYCDPALNVRIHVEEAGKNAIKILFSDHGTGIPAKYRKKIFNRFFRIPRGDVQKVKGFGMGLFYVRFIINKMGGRIQLVSSDENGTVFQLKLKKP